MHKVRMGQESHSQTLGVRVWLRETRVVILRYFLEVSRFVIAMPPAWLLSSVLRDIERRSYGSSVCKLMFTGNIQLLSLDS